MQIISISDGKKISQLFNLDTNQLFHSVYNIILSTIRT